MKSLKNQANVPVKISYLWYKLHLYSLVTYVKYTYSFVFILLVRPISINRDVEVVLSL